MTQPPDVRGSGPAAAWPGWMDQVAEVATSARGRQLSRWLPPDDGSARQAAVLLLFGAGQDGEGDVLLIERAALMRSHPGQVAFPGGAVDADDASPEAAALREAHEETGLDPAGVDVVGVLPQLFVPPSRFAVTPVVAWWREPSAIHAEAVEEVARVVRVPLAELLDPANRFSTRLSTGDVGPGFEAAGLFVWGFTAGLLARVLSLAGLERPWETRAVRQVPAAQLRGARAPAPVATPTLADAGLDDAGLDDAGLDDAGLDDAVPR